MDRRDIFNILFNRSSAPQVIMPEPDPVLFTPVHLRTDESRVVFMEWDSLMQGAKLPLNVSPEYSFTVTMALKYPAKAALNEPALHASLQLGIKETPMDSIQLGINNGRLFLGAETDLRVIDAEKLTEGIQLILTVNPLTAGSTYAKLKAVAQSGLTLSAIKSKEFTTASWIGGIIPGEYFSSLKIEGRQPDQHELI